MSESTSNGIDRRALKILFDTYWSEGGWRDDKLRSIPKDDFAYAKNLGVMFDDVVLSHDDIVARALAAVAAVNRKTVANAFVTSLASRRHDLRSALGSFAVLQHFPRHSETSNRGQCSVCAEWTRGVRAHDLNVLNFERFKWGGVRHDEPLYAAFDLELFSKAKHAAPSRADLQLLERVLRAIDESPPDTTAAALQKRLAKQLKSTKDEGNTVIGILGLCGILGTKAHPGYRLRFVPHSSRELPPRRFVDIDYPACWWRRADGVNCNAVNYWFGHLLGRC